MGQNKGLNKFKQSLKVNNSTKTASQQSKPKAKPSEHSAPERELKRGGQSR